MKIYYVDDKWNGPTIEEREVVKETTCFYMLNKDGPRYSKRCERGQMGRTVFMSAQEAITGFIGWHEKMVKDAKEVYECRVKTLEDKNTWARKKTEEL